jgi:WD40 repeat protein
MSIPARPPDAQAIPGYVILGELGAGGMGVVYKARQLRPGRLVALKMVRGGPGADPESLARFQREAVAVANLDHPNIVPIYEVGEHHGQPYFSMKLLEGGSLAQQLGRFRGDARAAARVVATIARAVHHAHQRGILHRDLKPGNILLDADGQPQVTDFGLAKRMGEADGFTATGALMGTPGYLAPEQARSEKALSVATDVWGLGAILYELLTGRPPFQAALPLDAVLQVLEREPARPRSLDPRTNADLETICLKCLEKEPRRRYRSAEALAEDLERWLRGEPIRARRVGAVERWWKWAKRRPAVAGLAAVLVLLLVGTAVASGLAAVRFNYMAVESENRRKDADRKRADAVEARQDAEAKARESRRRAVRLYVAGGMRLVDEGNYLAALPYLAEALRLEQGGPADEAVHRLRLGMVLQHCPRLLRVWHHPERDDPRRGAVGDFAFSFAFSPDGRRVATAGTDDARVWDVVTGEAACRPLDHPGIRKVAFSRNGRRLAGAGGEGVRVWDAATGAALFPPLPHAGAHHAEFSPDGRFLLSASSSGTACVWDVSGTKPACVTLKQGGPVKHAAFSPDGRLVATAGHGPVRLWDARTGQPFGKPIEHVRWGSGESAFRVAFSPDGTRLATANKADWLGSLCVWDVRTQRLLFNPLPHERSINAVMFSPDGRRLATASTDWTARVWDAQTGKPITDPLRHDNAVYGASFSPTGRFLVTASFDRTVRIWDVLTGKQAAPALPGMQALFSPDGRHVLTANPGGNARLWRLPSWRHASSRDYGLVHWAEFSPDGSRAILVRDSTVEIWAPTASRTGDGNVGMVPLLQHGSFIQKAVFSHDGRWVLTCGQDGTARVWDSAAGRPAPGLLRHKGAILDGAFSADGRRVVLVSADGATQAWDAVTGRRLGGTLRHGGSLRRAVLSRDAGRVLTVGQDRTARVWDVASGRQLAGPLRPPGGIVRGNFSPDGDRVVTAGLYHAARVWDAADGRALTPWLWHQGTVTFAGFSPDGRRVLTGSNDCTVRIWDAASGRPLTPPLEQHTNVFQAAFSPDGRLVATGVRLWDAVTGQPVAEPLKLIANPCADFSSDGRWLLLFRGGRQEIWELERYRRPVEDALLLAHALSGYRMDEEGNRVSVEPAAEADAVRTLRARYPGDFTIAPADAPRYLKHVAAVLAVALSADGRRALTGGADGGVRLWDTQAGTQLRHLAAGPSAVNAVALAPDGRLALSCSGKTVRVWDLEAGKELRAFNGHADEVRTIALSADGKLALSGGNDGIVRIWEVATAKEVRPLTGHTSSVLSAVFSADGKYVLSAGWMDRTVRLWEVATGKEVRRFTGHNGPVLCVAFAPDGRRAVSVSTSGGMVVWDVATGERLRDFLLRGGPITSVAFSRGGRIAAASRKASTVRVWDVERRRELAYIDGHADDVNCVALTPDGRLVLSGSADKTAAVWRVTAGD